MGQELLEKYKNLSEEHANLTNDYLSEREIRRSFQKTKDEKQSLVDFYERQLVSSRSNGIHAQILTFAKESSSFVLALIDGDGVIVSAFPPSYLYSSSLWLATGKQENIICDLYCST